MARAPDGLEPLLQATLGSQVRLVEYQVANQQPDYWVLLARLENPKLEVVIKLAGPTAQMASDFDRTAAIYRLVSRSTTLPMPEILALDTSLQHWPWRYMLRTALPGIEFSKLRKHISLPELAHAHHQIGEAVAQLHAVKFPAFGQIGATGEVGDPFHSLLEAVKDHARKIIPNARRQEAFLQALELRAGWFEEHQGAVLCHEDLHHGNILFTKELGIWRLATVLDFDKVWAGPAESDLARLELWRGMTSPEFWEAYQVFHTPESDYTQRRPVYQLLWCLEYARPTRQHLADTRRVCEELGCAIIQSFD